MIDETIPYHKVVMVKQNMSTYPRYEVPEGYKIVPYSQGMEQDWAEIAMEQFNYPNVEHGIELFRKEFGSHPEWMDRCLFVVDEAAGKAVSMTTLWEGGIFAEDYMRIHWVATMEAHQEKGLARALLSRCMDLYHELNAQGPAFLVTQTTSWQAIRIYKKFGFEAYTGEKPARWEDYDSAENRKAWNLIDERIAAWEAGRRGK